MKQARKYLAALLAAVLILAALPMAALAEDDPWAGAAEVENYAEFIAALEDETVESIRIVGDVVVREGSAESPLEANKPILVTMEGRLLLDPGAVVSDGAGMGLLSYESAGDFSVWDRIAEGMAAFLLWEDGDSVRRLLCGSQADGLDALRESGYGELSTAVFNGDIELDQPADSGIFYVMNGSLTTNDRLTVRGNLYVGGDLTIGETGSLELGEYGGWVDGDVNIFSGASMPEGLDCGGERNYPHLAVAWNGGGYGGAISMTPYDEYEVTFVLREYKDGRWDFVEVTPTIPAPLVYGEAEGHEYPTLTAKDAEWEQTYEVVYGEYSLPVWIELPELGCYSAPDATEENYLPEMSYSPLSPAEFYVMVHPDSWFLEDGWTVSDLTVRGVRYDENGPEELTQPPIACAKVREGVWKITVSGCAFSAEFTAQVLSPNGEDSFETGTGLYIEPVQSLVYSDTALDGSDNGWGIPWEEGFKVSLRDSLSMKAKSSKDVMLYLLVYQSEPEDGKPAGWYCEQVGVNLIRAEGVTLSEGNGESIRITAGSAGTHRVIRMQDEEQDGEWRPVPGSTRGLPLTVTVTSSGSSGSGSSGGSGSGTVVPNSGGGYTGGGAYYPISVPAQITGGTVSVRPQSAGKGAVVTVTAAAKAGYELSGLTVTAADGKAVSTTAAGNGQYTFTMPDSRVTVSASFQKAEEETAEPDSGSFADVTPGAYYAEAVRWAVEQGITGGTGEGTFSPDTPCSRAQTVTFLWRAAGSPAPSKTENPFRDVRPDAYYYNAVLWAVEQGITGGTSADAFSPEAIVTRGQTAAFLHRAAGSPAASGSSFADVASGAYYAEAVQWAVEQGITGGTGGGLFSPGASCTRAQIVTFLYRSQEG